MKITEGNCVNIQAVVFDVFGTLVQIGQKHHPYGQLLEKMSHLGRKPQPKDAARIMSNNVGLAGAAAMFGVDLPPAQIAGLEIELFAELVSIELFPDTLPTLQALRHAGFKMALCSNLAAPYAVPVKFLLPSLDAYAWSFEVGSVKPNPVIYQEVCRRLNCLPREVMMIGDNLESDCLAPRQLGMHGYHLARHGNSPVVESLPTLDKLLDILGCTRR